MCFLKVSFVLGFKSKMAMNDQDNNNHNCRRFARQPGSNSDALLLLASRFNSMISEANEQSSRGHSVAQVSRLSI